MSRALIVGSIAYDQIFSIHGDIRNEIIVDNNKVDKLNMMFTAKNKQQVFGGTGGNIAYGLGILKANPLLFSVVGIDFKADYKLHLENSGVDLKVYEDEFGWTATFYGISDEAQQQIGIWQPNVHGDLMETTPIETTVSDEDLEDVSIAIFSAGTGQSILNHMQEIRNKLGDQVKIIFDPGQVISIFYDKELLEKSLDLADIFIGNEVEVKQLERLLGYNIAEVLENVEYVIETRGEDGSTIHSKDGKVDIQAEKASKVAETTGAGDAFRSGLIYGLLNDNSIEESCKIGAKISAKSVEQEGPQGYEFN